MSTNPAYSVVRLGFGCFHFPPLLSEGDHFKARTWPSAVARALEESAGIDSVVLDVPKEDLAWESTAKGSPPSLKEEGSPFPHPDYFDLTFMVRIPARIQEELFAHYGPVMVDTERFKVHLRYGYEMPVAAVEPLGVSSTSWASPSRTVMLIREFLSREIARSEQQVVGFDCLGPSPAHADFYLRPGERPHDDRSKFWLLGHTIPAYHRYEYGYDPADFEHPSQVAEEFVFEATEEMSMYYKLGQEAWVRGAAWVQIDQAVEHLVALERERGPRSSFRRLFKSSRRLNEAQLALLEFERREVAIGGNLARELTKRYRGPSHPYARELVDEAHADQFQYPSKQLADLLSLFEKRRLTDREVLMLGLASVLGGALGAVGGLLAG